MQLYAVPPLDNLAAWAEPASADDSGEAVMYLATVCDPTLADNPNRLRTIAALVGSRGYTRPELLLAMQRLPFVNAYGGGLRLDAIESLIGESRKVRGIIGDPRDGRPRLLTERQMYDLCNEHPEHFRPEDFGICDYDVNDRPFFRYAKASGPHRHAPQPMLEDGSGARNDEPIRADLAELVARVTKQATGDGQADGTPEVQP